MPPIVAEVPREYNCQTMSSPFPWVVEMAQSFNADAGVVFPRNDESVYFYIQVVDSNVFYVHNDTPSGLPTVCQINIDGDLACIQLGPGRAPKVNGGQRYTIGQGLFQVGKDKDADCTPPVLFKWRILSTISFLEPAKHLWWTPAPAFYQRVMAFDASSMRHTGTLCASARTHTPLAISERAEHRLGDDILELLKDTDYLWQHTFIVENRGVWGTIEKGLQDVEFSTKPVRVDRQPLLSLLQHVIKHSVQIDSAESVFIPARDFNAPSSRAFLHPSIVMVENIVDTRRWSLLGQFQEALVEYAVRYALASAYKTYKLFCAAVATGSLCAVSCIHADICEGVLVPTLRNTSAGLLFHSCLVGAPMDRLDHTKVCASHLHTKEGLLYVLCAQTCELLGESRMKNFLQEVQNAYDVDCKGNTRRKKHLANRLILSLVVPEGSPKPARVPIHAILQNPSIVNGIQECAVALGQALTPQELSDLFDYPCQVFKDNADAMYHSIYQYYARRALPIDTLKTVPTTNWPPKLSAFYELFIAGPVDDPPDLALCGICFGCTDVRVEACGHPMCDGCMQRTLRAVRDDPQIIACAFCKQRLSGPGAKRVAEDDVINYFMDKQPAPKISKELELARNTLEDEDELYE